MRENGYDTVDEVFDDYKKGELTYLDAIETLEKEFDYSSIDAESTVDSWDA